MRIAIIAEGRSDIIVLENILMGIVGLDLSDIEYLRPQSAYDATHLAMMSESNKSTWSLVREECITKDKIEKFFQIEGNEFVVIHLDAAEREEYEIADLTINQDCSSIRNLIVNKIDEWLEYQYLDKILHAIAVEETEAWLLTVFENGTESCQWPDPKTRLNRILGRQKINTTRSYENYFGLSKNFLKKRNWIRERYIDYNVSLREFVQEVITKLHL